MVAKVINLVLRHIAAPFEAEVSFQSISNLNIPVALNSLGEQSKEERKLLGSSLSMQIKEKLEFFKYNGGGKILLHTLPTN